MNNNPYINEYGTKYWKNDKGKLHRIDGPAIEYADGDKKWFVNDKQHRIDGPAIEYSDGSKSWLINGKLHRIDGPAYQWDDGSKVWWINNRNISSISNLLSCLQNE